MLEKFVKLKWKRILGWFMMGVSFFPVALGLILLCNVAPIRGIIIMAICQFLLVIGVALVDWDREIEFRLLKKKVRLNNELE